MKQVFLVEVESKGGVDENVLAEVTNNGLEKLFGNKMKCLSVRKYTVKNKLEVKENV